MPTSGTPEEMSGDRCSSLKAHHLAVSQLIVEWSGPRDVFAAALRMHQLWVPKPTSVTFQRGAWWSEAIRRRLADLVGYEPSRRPECHDCCASRNLETALAGFERSRRLISPKRIPSLLVRRELLPSMKPVSPFDPVLATGALFEGPLPALSSFDALLRVVPPIRLALARQPDHPEMLLRLLRRVIRLVVLYRRLVTAHFRRLSHLPRFSLLVRSVMLRFGHRHDGDDHLGLPPRRFMFTAGVATTV
uniref:hypothetical protein n=1 Tax=Herbidospora sakaeratensis TaxID=564415 RepID=UPI000A4EBD54|nr:hypothetical protein [Herbidospora sakaeratensis]